MNSFHGQTGRSRRRFAPWLAAAVVLASNYPVMARDDGGVGAFFREQFGIGQSSPSEPIFQDPDQSERSLIVRPKHKRSEPRVAVAKGPTVPVSIYDDRTLRPGDAVMTAKGLRIFVGSRSMPHSEADFVALAAADGLPRQVQKSLLLIDREPRI